MGATTLMLMAACSEERGGGADGGAAGMNRARFTYDCDLGGVTGILTVDVEAIQASGAVFGPGPNPELTAVIATGEVLYITSGMLVSPAAHYVFTGENAFADFTELNTGERFRVQWMLTAGGVIVVVNPFGPAPTQFACVSTGAAYL